MSREKKKGTSGNAKAFITRAKALKKLQLSLPEFRRLCILKGIYPRDPKKKLEGLDKTYYLRKDIDFLAHERLITTIRQENAHRKKEVKARAKRRIDVLKRLALSKPQARLDHLVLERYPRFEDAIRELDDPLCVIALFANLPADRNVGIAPNRVSNCQRLLKEFHLYVSEKKALKRVFVSIKGYYFQAKIAGELVTWVLPHRFAQILPADVDYSVMLTFLELYECILSFVNFRLYTSANMAYPPKISRVADAKGLELASIQVQKLVKPSEAEGASEAVDAASNGPKISSQVIEKAQKIALTSIQADDEEDGDEEKPDLVTTDADVAGDESEKNEENDGDDEDDGGENTIPFGVFAERSFVLGREVPYVELEFMLRACGATRVTREDDLPEGPERLAMYTHWILDRPKVAGKRDMKLEYVQPQYVFDSINADILLPTALYAPGAHLPPHLSPFVSGADDGGYKPWFKDVIDRIKAGDASVVEEAAAVVYAEGAAKAKKAQEEKEQKTENVRSNDSLPKSKTGRYFERKVVNDEMNGGSTPKELQGGKSEPDGDDRPAEGAKGERRDSTPGLDVEVKSMSELDNEGQRKPKRNHDDEDMDAGENEEAENEEEEDEEGKEEELVKHRESKMETEGKEMAALMLSRKKMKLFKKQKRADDAKAAVRSKLESKRKKLESERDKTVPRSSPKKRRRR